MKFQTFEKAKIIGILPITLQGRYHPDPISKIKSKISEKNCQLDLT